MKSIHVHPTRKKDGEKFDFGGFQATTNRAAESLFRCELGFGGSITTLEKEKIIVETRVMHCEDKTVFTGPEDAMIPLHHGIFAFLKCKNINYDAKIERALEITHGNALLITMGAGLLMNESPARIGMICCMTMDPSLITRMAKFSWDDLESVYQLADEGFTLSEAICAAE